jgi:dienelactone hydrolase
MRFVTLSIVLIATALVSGCASGNESEGPYEINTSTVDYEHDGVALQGYLAVPEGAGKRPGVLIIHEWWGHNEFAREQAERLAREGYVAFACDMYGTGVKAETAEAAGALAGQFYTDRDLFRARARAGLDTLAKQPGVDADKLGAIGFCFGGTGVLELARSGAPVDVVVSFHGGLTTTKPAKEGAVKATVLVCNGFDDPHVKPEDRQALMGEMNGAKVDWQFIEYGHAVHSFTNPGADKRGIDGVGYNEPAAMRSWQAMLDLFSEKLGQ